MTTVTESDLRELKELIQGIDKKLDLHIVRTDEQLKAINNTIAQLDKRIDEINVRINTFALGFLGIVGILVTRLLGIVGKVVFFPNP